MSRSFYIVVTGVLLAGCGVAAVLVRSRRGVEAALASEEQRAVQTAREIQRYRNSIRRMDVAVESGMNFSDLLKDAGLTDAQVAVATQAAQSAWNLRRIVPGHAMWVERTIAAGITSIAYRIDSDRELRLAPGSSGFQASIREVPSQTRTAVIHGKLESSLFESIEAAGEQPELAVRFADILAWDIDFYTDPRPGDDFAIVVEKKEYTDGTTAAYGRVLAVRYDNAGHVHEAVLFHDPAGKPAYYTSQGKSLQKAFLKSPLKFAARVSSHFSQHRFHPVLKIYRPHLGTDYAAPIGTPVQAVASGRVVSAGNSGGGGNMVKIAHANGYETYYLHLSRILVRRGANVQQGQRIGLVGMTGLATGPHLDFRVQKRGQFVNFERMPLPPATPVAKKDWAEFASVRDKWVTLLPGADTAVAQARPDSPAGGTK